MAQKPFAPLEIRHWSAANREAYIAGYIASVEDRLRKREATADDYLPAGIPAEDLRRYLRTFCSILYGKWHKPLVEARCPKRGHLRLAVHDTAWGPLVTSVVRVAPAVADVADLDRFRGSGGNATLLLDHLTEAGFVGGCRCRSARYSLEELMVAVNTARTTGSIVRLTLR